jgi:hypothetical protein
LGTTLNKFNAPITSARNRIAIGKPARITRPAYARRLQAVRRPSGPAAHAEWLIRNEWGL